MQKTLEMKSSQEFFMYCNVKIAQRLIKRDI